MGKWSGYVIDCLDGGACDVGEISCKEGVGHGIGKESGWTIVGVV